MAILGVISLIVWFVYALVEGRAIAGIIGLLIVAGFIGFFWNWFFPVVFAIELQRASFFTLLWVPAFAMLMLEVSLRILSKTR